MARARLLKPSFFTNADLGSLPMGARLLFQGLWCVADREGRLKDDVRRIKVEILPYDKANVDHLLDLLARAGFIQRYESGGHRFIQVLAFARHQSPHVREPASTIPAPCAPGAGPMLAPVQAGTGPAVAVSGDPVSGDPETVAVADPFAAAAAAHPNDEAVVRLIREWERATGTLTTPRLGEQIAEWLADIGEAWTLDAIRETGDAGAKSARYTQAIIDRWKRDGRDVPSAEPADPSETARQRYLGGTLGHLVANP